MKTALLLNIIIRRNKLTIQNWRKLPGSQFTATYELKLVFQKETSLYSVNVSELN